MTRLDLLRKNYQRICGLPWDRSVAGPQRVWQAVYDKEDERKLRLRLDQFDDATRQTRHGWHCLDLTDDGVLADFKQSVVGNINGALDQLANGEDAVLALYGVASLFGFLRISE